MKWRLHRWMRAAFDLGVHACCLVAVMRLVVDSLIVEDPVEFADRNCCLEDGVLAAETTVKTRWLGAAYQMQRSIDYNVSAVHMFAFER